LFFLADAKKNPAWPRLSDSIVRFKAFRPFDRGAPNLPEGIVDSPGTSVTPQSLYLAQLAERLGPQAVRNIGY
jgi:hypothetical protein